MTILRLRPDDPVAVALDDLHAGDVEADVTLIDDVPRGHKVALVGIAEDAPVHKYGQVIGYASQTIRAGEHVHTHNVRFADVFPEYTYGGDTTSFVKSERMDTFDGIVRADGRVATRNYIGILTSVNCSATVAKFIADQVRTSGMLADYPGIDGVVAITHGTGCGIGGDGEGLEVLQRTIGGYARHPNFGALLVVGLGCEMNQIHELTGGFDVPESTPVHSMTIQEAGGTIASVKAGVATIRDLLPSIGNVTRTPVPASELILGVECGGSDGYSGITANPALGVAADILIAQGGTAVLGETPEIYGAEHLLAARAVSREVAEKLLARIEWWRGYVAKYGGSLDNNPSPGNKAGGITTILEKSLGAVAKSGSSPLTDVVEYAQPVTSKGLVFMDTPGYDPVSVTGKVAGGAHVVCFTTGRGSVYGCKPVPSIKLATNSDVYRRMRDDMDINCGEIVDDGVPLEEMGQRVFDLVLETASGKQTRSEELGFGEEEFAPWQLGAVM